MLTLWHQHGYFFLIIIAIFGLCVGSFLNVVIYRLPIMMRNQWRMECADFLKQPLEQTPAPFNLCLPRSHCPQCKTKIAWWHNLPLLSFIVLKGKCHFCQHRIPWRYPLVELLTGLVTLFLAYHFGPTWQMLGAWLLSWILIAGVFIDLDHLLLPDELTLSLLWLGLIWNLTATFTSLDNAVIGAIVGYVFLWTIAWLFKKIRKIDGMGHGDFKLTAALGAWFGWKLLPAMILLAALAGAVIGIVIIAFKKYSRSTPLPFGPYLAVAGWVSLIWGEQIMHWYLRVLLEIN